MVTSAFKPDFTYFLIMNNSGKFKEISRTSFYCIIYFLKILMLRYPTDGLLECLFLKLRTFSTLDNPKHALKLLLSCRDVFLSYVCL